MTEASVIQKAAEKAEVKKAESKTALSARGTMQAYVQKMSGEIAKALPSVITPERFTRIVMSTLSTNQKLCECTPQSFIGSMMTAAQLGVEPNTPLGQAYLIPRRNGRNNTTECQFQLGYKGLIDLAYRSGQISTIGAEVVHENDEFTVELGIDQKLYHKPAMKDRGAVVAYYAYYKTKDGGYGFEVMSISDVQAHAKRFSDSYSSSYSPWSTNFDEMAKKTVLKKVLKYAPMKTDFAKAVAMDGSVHDSVAEDMTIENASYPDIIEDIGTVEAT